MNKKTGEIRTETFEAQHLTIGQAIDYMLESDKNEVQYYDTFVSKIQTARIIYMEGHQEIHIGYKDRFIGDIVNIYNELPIRDLKSWTKIRKHIEPKKTIKQLIQAKEPFQYKDNWYRFNKDGAIIDSKGSALGIDRIIELLDK